MEPSEKELIKKLAAMKEELNVKQRKLDKSKRATSVKAYVRQKIQEQNLVKCTPSIKLSVVNHSDSQSEITRLDCALIHEPSDCDLQNANSYNMTRPEATLSSTDNSLINSALAVPCFSLDEKPTEMTTEFTSHNSLKELDRFLQNGEKHLETMLQCQCNNVTHLKNCVLNETTWELNQSTDRENVYDNENSKTSLNLRCRTKSVPSKRSRQESPCNDDFMHYNKAHKFSRSRQKCRMNSLQPAKCKTLSLNKYSHSLAKKCQSDTFHKPLIPNKENCVKLFKEKSATIEAAQGKSKFLRNDGSVSLFQDLYSFNVDASKIGTQLNDLVPDKCFEAEYLLNQIPQKVLTDVSIRPCENTCDTTIFNNKFKFIDCVEGKEMSLNEKRMDVDMEHCEIIQHLTETYVSCSSKTGHCVNGKDFEASSYKSSNQLLPRTSATTTIDTTNDPDVKSNNNEVSPLFSMPRNIATVTKQVYQVSLDITDFSRTDKDENKHVKSRKKSNLSNESDEGIVKGSQISMVTMKPPPCCRRQSLSLNADHTQNTLSLTPSFGSIDPLSNKSGVETIKDELSLYKQEPVTDSEFFSILGFTQTEKEVLNQKESQAVPTPKRQNYNRFSSINHTDNNDCDGKLHIRSVQNVVDIVSASNTFISTPLSSNNKEKLSKLNTEMLDKLDNRQTATETINSEAPFLEYTELDVIPYSQFELTEDFLSETQTGMSKACSRATYSGALVKRRSPRISSFCFTHSNSLSVNGSLRSSHLGSKLANFVCTTPNVKHKQRRSLTQQKRTASILSAFQFLMDDAKKTNSFLEFELPISFDILKTSRTESALKPPLFFEAQVNAGSKKDIIGIEEECCTDINILSSKCLFEDLDKQSFSVKKKDQEQSLTTMQESIDEGNIKNVRNICADNVEGFMYHLDTTEDLSNRKQLSGMLDDCTTPLRQKNKHISKLGRRLSNPSIAKKLFVSKNVSINAGFHGFIYKTCRDNVGHSADIKVIPFENVSDTNTTLRSLNLLDAGASSSQKTSVISFPVGMLTSPEIDISSPRPGCSVKLCETPRKSNTLCINSLSDSLNEQFITPEPILHNFRDSIPLLSTPTNVLKASQTSSARIEFASPELNSSFLHSPNPVTPVSVTSDNLSSSQKLRGGFSFTSTPKFTASYKTKCAISGQGLKSSVEVSTKKAESGGLAHYSPLTTTSSLLIPLSPDLSIASKDQVLSPDESYLSPAQIPVDGKVLSPDESYLSPAQIPVHGKDLLAARESPADVTLISSPDERLNISLARMSCLSTTSGNLITPWKQLPKTASTPLLVLEKEDSRNHLGVPVFSPIIKRSRSKPSSNNTNTSHLPLRFAGCFQCCAQDAVVSLLTGTFKTPEIEEKYYIVSVQATSLTVWTEDDLYGWTAELDWRLSSEIHVMKACLLPRTDTVIAVVASGRDKENLLATLFMYDCSTEDTARFNIPVLEQQNQLKFPTQIELCPFLASELHIAVTSDTHHTVGRVIFTDSVRAVQSLSMFGVHRGKLVNFVALSGQVSANVSLTGDQEVSIWNMKLGVVIKKVKLQSSLPCLTGLLAATSNKGILLLDTVWRVDDGHCGGVIAVNPLTGRAKKIIKFSVPNNTWRSVESATIEQNVVTAISDKGALGMWDKRNGVLLGHTKSKITTCASLTVLAKHLIVGEIYGCLHIYSAPN